MHKYSTMETNAKPMPKSFIAFYDTPKEVEAAIIKLQKNKCDIGKLSIVAIDLSTYKTQVSRLNVCHMSYWAIAGSVIGLLVGCTFWSLLAKPFFKVGVVNTLLILVEMAVIGAMIAALLQIVTGRAKSSGFSLKLKADKYLILSKGDEQQINRERNILDT